MTAASLLPGLRLTAAVALLTGVWLGFLPWLGRWRAVDRHVRLMESLDVNPAAMVYTELEHLPLRPAWAERQLRLWP